MEFIDVSIVLRAIISTVKRVCAQNVVLIVSNVTNKGNVLNVEKDSGWKVVDAKMPLLETVRISTLKEAVFVSTVTKASD
jgi:hypothetical protein